MSTAPAWKRVSQLRGDEAHGTVLVFDEDYGLAVLRREGRRWARHLSNNDCPHRDDPTTFTQRTLWTRWSYWLRLPDEFP